VGGGGDDEEAGSLRKEVQVEVTWPRPDGPSALVWRGGKVAEVVKRWPGPSTLERKGTGGGDVAGSR
jgi:hypothetical protein